MSSSSSKVTPPLETKVNMDNDYDYYVSKYSSQPPPPPPPGAPPKKETTYNLGVSPMERESVDGEEALMDLAQLEELHHEAERMKALGNKHMAAQEYTRAYNAYSAALQLSPVGPSSHVFLSNRSASLLSLKRYSAAATDARRAIALAPTFGKAHARLGQSLYFLKDYAGSVAAYEDSIHFEPDNQITRTYLEKAKAKQERQAEKLARSTRGEEVSVLTAESSMHNTIANSIATDPNAAAAVVQTMGFRGQSKAMSKAVAANYSARDYLPDDDEDPDFEEALRIQERANKYLGNKHYKFAIEEYTAALFLVPDDDNLSPDLHLGRAHALNGSRRHDSAMVDAKLAIKIKPTPEAYSTLAKSYFYMQDYQASIDSFAQCKAMLPDGESLSMFDRAYLQKAEKARQDEISEGSFAAKKTSHALSYSTPIPKLKPPRFVPREEALSRTPIVPAMPKAWPQQSPRSSQILQVGPEREVLFLSEALGIKLNRGPDGTVRVIDVSPEIPGSPIARRGKIEVGDVVREAAGVDIRRPITNIMWGDTVALIKMAPRPIVLVLAKELNPEASISQQRVQAAINSLSPTSAAQFYPSNSSGDKSVKEQMKESGIITSEEREETQEIVPETTDATVNESVLEISEDDNNDTKTLGLQVRGDLGMDLEETPKENESDEKENPFLESKADTGGITKEEEEKVVGTESKTEYHKEALDDQIEDRVSQTGQEIPDYEEQTSLRDEESKIVGAEIVFQRTANKNFNGWDNLRWMAYAGARKVVYCELVYRFVPGLPGLRTIFWSGDQYVTRKLAIYEEPSLILILRPPESLAELREIMDLPVGAEVEDSETAFKSYLLVESVIDQKTCKLRLSSLTTPTSILSDVSEGDFRRRSCFELICPSESVILSNVRLRTGAERALTSFTDSGAFLETSSAEYSLQKAICNEHKPSQDSGNQSDLSWQHQIILGTLHSFVVLGDQHSLDMALAAAVQSTRRHAGPGNSKYVDARVIDAMDESGRTPLHYACTSRFSSAVVSLVKYGADVNTRVHPHKTTLSHICAKNLDAKSLGAILSVSRRPNVTDSWGRTPMYLAITEGRTVGGLSSPEALERSLSILESFGGDIQGSAGFRHPVSYLASIWSHEELSTVLNHVNYRYPLVLTDTQDKKRTGMSLSALYQYPVHSALVSLRKKIKAACEGKDVQTLWSDCSHSDKLIKTLESLLVCGFEPNERLEGLHETFDGLDELAIHVGFAPIQIVAAAALDIAEHKDLFGETLYMGAMALTATCTEFLVKNGARLSLDEPPVARSIHRSPSSVVDCHTSSESGNEHVKPILRSKLKIQSNPQLADFLGVYRLDSAQLVWGTMKSVQSIGRFVFHTDKLAIEDSEAPGGSDEKTCAICWKAFGTLMNRKHRCRISRRHVCDECSSKRVVEGKEEHRVSDGQFLLARADEVREESRKLEAAKKKRMALQQPVTTTAARLERLEAEESARRDSLFGGVMESMSKAVFGGEEEETGESHAGSVEGLSAQLNQTRDALNERGEKLNTLADKSERLANASKDFASMAKELNRQTQNQGFFW